MRRSQCAGLARGEPGLRGGSYGRATLSGSRVGERVKCTEGVKGFEIC